MTVRNTAAPGSLRKMTTEHLNELVRKHTAFASFSELVNAAGNYRPSLDVRDTERKAIADEYDQHMRREGDARRAYRYGDEAPAKAGDTWSRELNQAVRYGVVLAVLGQEVLWIYQMPAGRQFMGIDGPADTYRSQSLNGMPKKWQKAIADQHGVLLVDDALDALGYNVTEWRGRPNMHEQERREWARANRVPDWVRALPCNQAAAPEPEADIPAGNLVDDDSSKHLGDETRANWEDAR